MCGSLQNVLLNVLLTQLSNMLYRYLGSIDLYGTCGHSHFYPLFYLSPSSLTLCL